MMDAVQFLHAHLGRNDMMAYLVMMAIRLKELHRVLKPTGSIYLHCDPTASHYLKMILDLIFGPKQFLNEIVWKRSSAHSDTKQGMKRCGRLHDIIFLYSKTKDYTWNPVYQEYDEGYLKSEYRHRLPSGRYYKETDLTAAKPGGDTSYLWRVKRRIKGNGRWEADLDEEYLNPKEGWEYKGVLPYHGRYWAYSKENMIGFARKGNLIHRETGMPRLIQFSDEMLGVPLQDIWVDITPELGSKDLGFQTQKPEALLQRIISSSSNQGDIVLDPFCGCGTAVSVAQQLKRSWIGIDITHLAISLIRSRLKESNVIANKHYEIIGEPVDLASAKELASTNPYQFQWWALSLIDARPTGQSSINPAIGKKGADKGVDGWITFRESANLNLSKIVVQVKGGHVSAKDVRDLIGTVDSTKSARGILITLEEPTQPMKEAAMEAEYYESPTWGHKYPKIQIITVEQLLSGIKPILPHTQSKL